MTFRPAPFLTIAMLAALALLIALGSWQLRRLAWKEALIARVEARIHEAPTPLDEALAGAASLADLEYAPVRIRGRFDHDREIHLYANYHGAPGYFIITPLMRADGDAVLVNRGYVPVEFKEKETRAAGLVEGEVEIAGLLRASRDPAPFAPKDQIDDNIWFTADAAAMAFVAGIEAPPFFVDALASETAGQWPRGGVTRVEFRNAHLGYALTWFGLAAALIGVYLAHQWSAGRIRIGVASGKKPSSEATDEGGPGAGSA